MVVSPAPSLNPSEPFAPYEYVRPIGSRPNPLHIVRHAAPREKPRLIVAERFVGAAAASIGQAAAFISEARRISTLASPNVARVRELAVRGDDLVVFWDFIDGDKLADHWLSGTIPLELALRLVLDVLSGAGAIHALRDAKQQPMHLAHGELSTSTVVLGVDGIARILHTIARRLPGAQAEGASLGYLAPEVHAGDVPDARADVFGAGVLLWEALSGERLFPEADSVAILARLRGPGVGLAAVPAKAPWAKALVQVAAKALAVSPEDRWPTAAAMAAEIRRVAGLRLAPAAAASSFAQAVLGERAKSRRERLEAAVPQHAVALENPPQAALWSAPPVAAGPAARRWSDADSSSVGSAISVPESLPPSALNSVIPEPLDMAVQIPSPPPLPERALQPPAGAPIADEASSGSDLAASIDVPVSLAPPSEALEGSPGFIDHAEPVELDRRVNRRRTAAVLGGVSALGLIVFALAGWRVAHRSPAHQPSVALATFSPAAPTATPGVVPVAPAPLAAQPPPVTSAAPASAPVPPASPHVSHTAAPPRSAPPPPPTRPTSANIAPRKLASPTAPARPKASQNARFDPNSL